MGEEKKMKNSRVVGNGASEIDNEETAGGRTEEEMVRDDTEELGLTGEVALDNAIYPVNGEMDESITMTRRQRIYSWNLAKWCTVTVFMRRI